MRAVDLDVADAVLDGDVEGVVSGECVAVGLSVGVGALVTVEAPASAASRRKSVAS